MRVFLAVLVFIVIVAFTLEIAASKPVKQLRRASVRSIKTGGNNCGQFNCGASDRCCSNNFIGPYRNQCYNPSTHHCIPDGFKPSQNCLCGVNDGCCNQVCFDPRHYSCDTSTGRLKQIPSPPPTNNCGQFQCGWWTGKTINTYHFIACFVVSLRLAARLAKPSDS